MCHPPTSCRDVRRRERDERCHNQKGGHVFLNYSILEFCNLISDHSHSRQHSSTFVLCRPWCRGLFFAVLELAFSNLLFRPSSNEPPRYRSVRSSLRDFRLRLHSSSFASFFLRLGFPAASLLPRDEARILWRRRRGGHPRSMLATTGGRVISIISAHSPHQGSAPNIAVKNAVLGLIKSISPRRTEIAVSQGRLLAGTERGGRVEVFSVENAVNTVYSRWRRYHWDRIFYVLNTR